MSFVGLLAAGLLTAALPFAVATIASWLRARSKELSQRMNTQQLQMVQTQQLHPLVVQLLLLARPMRLMLLKALVQ